MLEPIATLWWIIPFAEAGRQATVRHIRDIDQVGTAAYDGCAPCFQKAFSDRGSGGRLELAEESRRGEVLTGGVD
jgi:hypothetical protein